MELRHWPFDVGPREKFSDEDSQIVDFLEEANLDGYKPYDRGIGSFSYGATAQNHRAGEIIIRGRNRWELILGAEQEEVLSAYLDDFGCAADAVLFWLRGGDAREILTGLHDHLVRLPGASRSFALNLPGEQVTQPARPAGQAERG